MTKIEFCSDHGMYHRPFSKAALACESQKATRTAENLLVVPLKHVEYRHGAEDFVFYSSLPIKGGDSKPVKIVVPTEFLRKLGANLNDTRIEGNGHALWHTMNPDREIPCETCGPEGKRIAEARQNAIEAEVAPAKLGDGER